MEQKRNSKTNSVHGRVYFIGSGPGDPELLTIKGRNIILSADLIIYAGSLVNPLLLSGVKKSACILDSASMTLEEISAAMVSAARREKTVAGLNACSM